MSRSSTAELLRQLAEKNQQSERYETAKAVAGKAMQGEKSGSSEKK